MAKSLEDCIEESYQIGDEIPLTRGKKGIIEQVHFNKFGKIEKIDVRDDKGNIREVPMMTKHDVHRKK